MKHSSKFVKDMIYNKIGKVLNMENVMKIFNINHVEKRKYYKNNTYEKKR